MSAATSGTPDAVTVTADLADIAAELPSPTQAAAGVATSAAGNLLAGLAIPWPVKAALIAGPLLFVGWRWLKGRK